MFLLSRVTWYDNGRQSIDPTAVADNVPALQTWAQEVENESLTESITLEWAETDSGLMRTLPYKFGQGHELWSISEIIGL